MSNDVRIDSLTPGTLCAYSGRLNLLVWVPIGNIHEALGVGEAWAGRAFSCNEKPVIMMILGDVVGPKQNQYVPVLLGSHGIGLVHARLCVEQQ